MKFAIRIVPILAVLMLSACGPAVIAGAGAAGVVIADRVAEDDGDDGLF